MISKDVIFDFNTFFKVNIKKRIQVATIISLVVYIMLFLTNYNMKYFIYFPIILLLLSFINNPSSSITRYGIIAKKVNNGIITWGQIQSYEISDKIDGAKHQLKIKYLIRDDIHYENEIIKVHPSDKYEIESTLNSMNNFFNKKDQIPFKKFSMFRKVFLALMFTSYFILLMKGLIELD